MKLIIIINNNNIANNNEDELNNYIFNIDNDKPIYIKLLKK